MSRNISIQDIAERLNMSRNTVSKVFNGHYVPRKTKEEVLRVAKELNYKGMGEVEEKEEISYKILLLSAKPLANINYFYPLIKGAENYCYETGHQLIQYTLSKGLSFYALGEYIKNIKVDGILCIEAFKDEFINNLLKLDIPTVFVDFCLNLQRRNYKYDILMPNSVDSIIELLKKINEKHKIKEYAFVGDPLHCLSFYQRYFAFNAGMSLEKINHDNSLDITYKDEEGYGNIIKLKGELSRRLNKVNCYICGNDYIARNVINALKSIGKNVPADALVIGFDDAEEALSGDPSITTISIDKEGLGKQAVETLIGRIQRKDKSSTTIYIDSHIVYRESTNK